MLNIQTCFISTFAGCKCGIFSVRNENVTKHPTFQGSQEHPLHPALKEGLLLLALSQDI